ncbi:MAG: TauD/TfdA family dioxygenase [Pseudomonadota bacterium]
MAQTSTSTAQAWTGAELSRTQDWITPLAQADVAEIREAVRSVESRGIPLFDIRAEDFVLPRLAPRLTALRQQLEGGRGFALLRGLPVDEWSLESNQRVVWGLAQHLGLPEGQDRLGSLMHNVRNTGKQVAGSDSTRGYETDDELTFHNDGGDAFMLLCLKTAVDGGVSKLISSTTLFNEVQRRRPDLLPVLQAPFHFDLRGQNAQGQKVQSVPIFNLHAGRVNVLYKKRFILQAQRFEEVPRLSPQQQEAIDLLETLCADPSIYLSFSMQRGDIQVGSNHAVLHSRTSYVDHEDVAERRHLLRVWLTLANGRPLPPVYATTREFGATYARRMQQAEPVA